MLIYDESPFLATFCWFFVLCSAAYCNMKGGTSQLSGNCKSTKGNDFDWRSGVNDSFLLELKRKQHLQMGS